MKLGLLTAAFPDLSLEEVAAWAAGERLRDARGRVLAVGRRRGTAVRGSHAHRRRRARHRRRARDARAARARDLVARLLPEQPPSGRRAPRAGERAPAQGDRRGAGARRRHRRHVRRQRQGPPAAREPRPLPPDLAGARRVRGRSRREDRDRELPDDLQLRRVAGRHEPGVVAGDLGRDVRRDPGRELRAQPRPVAPRVADDRLRAGGLRLRASGSSTRTRRISRSGATASTVTARFRAASAGRCRASPGSARSTGRGSSPRCTPSATTTSSRSSTRTAASRGRRSSSSAAS